MMKSQPESCTKKLSKLKISKLCLVIVFLGLIKVASLSSLIFFSEEFNLQTSPRTADIDKIIEKNKLSSSNLAFAEEATPATQAAPQAAASNTAPKSLVPKVNAMPSPISPEIMRPDEVMPGDPPAPNVVPVIPNDSAKRKEEELARREQELLQLQQQMNSRLEELKATEDKLGNMVQEANKSEDNKISHLIDLYTNMKPKQAAAALAAVDEKIAVQILQGMKGRQAGEILSYMDTENAARLSEALSKMQM